MPAQPLRERDYRLASRAMRELESPSLTKSELRDILAGLVPVFDAQDVSMTLHDVSASNPSAKRPWFLHFDSSDLMSKVERSPQGHRPMQVLHRSGLRVMRLANLPAKAQQAILRSEFMRTFERQSGMHRALVGHLGDHDGGSIGRIAFFRPRDHVEFDDGRAMLLQNLYPALTEAARGILLRSIKECGRGETALLNAAGQILWMTAGFRFLWNAVNPRPISGKGLLPSTLLVADATSLERAVAFQVILLDAEGNEDGCCPGASISVGGNGRGSRVTVRFETVPGQTIGCIGRLLRLCLERDRG